MENSVVIKQSRNDDNNDIISAMQQQIINLQVSTAV